MNKFFKLLALLSSIAISAFSQKECDCLKTLKYVAEQIENNSASFAHQVIEYKRVSDYDKHKKQVEEIAKALKTEKECLGILQFYLSFLRDAHQKLYVTNEYYPFKTFDDTIEVKKFLDKNVENFALKENQPHPILGNWHYKDGIFSIQIQENNQKGRKYIGILTKSIKINNQFLGNKGDLKIEFYKNYQGELYAICWSFGQQPSSHKVEIHDSILTMGRNLIFYRDSSKSQITNKYRVSDTTFFQELNEKTNYLRIHTFDYKNKKNIDSILVHNRKKLLSKNNLIIDIRNNGGGSDLSFYSLLPFIMDKKTFQDPIAASSIWISKNNFQHYYNERYRYDVYTKQDSINADKEIEELRKHLGTFQPYTKSVSMIDETLPYPTKVFILQNRWDASSAEGFVLTAKQSGKVKTFGENTGGFVSYGEWRKLEIPNFPAWISMTQKKMIFYDDSDFETIGIEPDFKLNPDNEYNWIEFVKNEIEK